MGRPKGSQNRRGYGSKGPEPTPATDQQIFCFCDKPWADGPRCLKCGKRIREG